VRGCATPRPAFAKENSRSVFRQQRRYVAMHDSITNQLVVMMDPKMDEGYEPVVVYPLRVSLQLNLAAIKGCAERIRILI
jgi:hypothetical protein